MCIRPEQIPEARRFVVHCLGMFRRNKPEQQQPPIGFFLRKPEHVLEQLGSIKEPERIAIPNELRCTLRAGQVDLLPALPSVGEVLGLNGFRFRSNDSQNLLSTARSCPFESRITTSMLGDRGPTPVLNYSSKPI